MEKNPSFNAHDRAITHYYGDNVRKLMLLAAVVLMVTILVDKNLLTFNLRFGVLGILIITILAGFTNPKSRASIVADTIVSGLMFFFFEYFAVSAYTQTDNFFDSIFLFRQVTAVIFLVALYFSTKSLRGTLYR